MDQRVTYHAKVHVLANNHINTRPACQPVDLMVDVADYLSASC